MKLTFSNCIVVLTICIGFSSCKLSAPTLKSLNKVAFVASGSTGFKAGTDAVIHNPNPVRVKIKEMNLVALVNGKPVGTIGKMEPILIKRKSDFTVPLTIEIASLESIFKDFKSILGLLTKDVELEVKGNVKLRAFLFLRRNFTLQSKTKVALPEIK
jgi:hypothetical protein